MMTLVLSAFFPDLESPLGLHHGIKQHSRHIKLGLSCSGVCRRCAARKPLSPLPETCLGLHAGQLHQVPNSYVGIALCSRVHLYSVLSARFPLSVYPLYAEIQDSAGMCVFYVMKCYFTF